MRFRYILFFTLLFTPLFAQVENSILPNLELPCAQEKLNIEQKNRLQSISKDNSLRVMTFNMLFNFPDVEKKMPIEHRWCNRGKRVLEYLKTTNADLIGSQELQKDQLDFLSCELKDKYLVFGKPSAHEISAIFYNKERLELLSGQMIPYKKEGNGFTVCKFRDRKTGKMFTSINTHLTYGKIENRYQEALILKDFISAIKNEPVILMGDLNTFPFRPDLDLPFYDGDTIIAILEKAPLENCSSKSQCGNFGPCSSTNFSPEAKCSFAGKGTPGVILDHIFTTHSIDVIHHAIDPATVDGHFPSDHFPVIADIIVK